MALATFCFDALGAIAAVALACGTLVVGGGGVDASWAGGAAEADDWSMYSHAVPIAGANPKAAIVVAANNLFMIAS